MANKRLLPIVIIFAISASSVLSANGTCPCEQNSCAATENRGLIELSKFVKPMDEAGLLALAEDTTKEQSKFWNVAASAISKFSDTEITPVDIAYAFTAVGYRGAEIYFNHSEQCEEYATGLNRIIGAMGVPTNNSPAIKGIAAAFLTIADLPRTLGDEKLLDGIKALLKENLDHVEKTLGKGVREASEEMLSGAGKLIRKFDAKPADSETMDFSANIKPTTKEEATDKEKSISASAEFSSEKLSAKAEVSLDIPKACSLSGIKKARVLKVAKAASKFLTEFSKELSDFGKAYIKIIPQVEKLVNDKGETEFKIKQPSKEMFTEGIRELRASLEKLEGGKITGTILGQVSIHVVSTAATAAMSLDLTKMMGQAPSQQNAAFSNNYAVTRGYIASDKKLAEEIINLIEYSAEKIKSQTPELISYALESGILPPVDTSVYDNAMANLRELKNKKEACEKIDDKDGVEAAEKEIAAAKQSLVATFGEDYENFSASEQFKQQMATIIPAQISQGVMMLRMQIMMPHMLAPTPTDLPGA
ncbi:hypothetical protein HOD08_03215 [bacterium]|nr:hypothetical protein [bacterium]